MPRKPGMTRDDLFNINAGILAGVCESIARVCINQYLCKVSSCRYSCLMASQCSLAANGAVATGHPLHRGAAHVNLRMQASVRCLYGKFAFRGCVSNTTGGSQQEATPHISFNYMQPLASSACFWYKSPYIIFWAAACVWIESSF